MKQLIFLFSLLAAFSVSTPSAFADYDSVSNAFIVAPAKHEIRLGPGESVIRNVYITNRLGYDADFSISVEDVSGSKDESEIVKYYGSGLGPYSIRNYVVAGDSAVSVPDGETKVVPVMISLPARQKPGSLYGGIFVSAVPREPGKGARVATRIGSLIFLRVKGDAIERGSVKRFGALGGGAVLPSGEPVEFQVSFENTGNVYLNPYGAIELRDSKGKLLDRLPIDPWFVFPDSVRTRIVPWNGAPWFGRVTATLVLNHGYSAPHGTTLEYRFYILPYRPFLWIAGLLGAALAGWYAWHKLRHRIKKWQV